jgi:hypothetical protein
MGLQTFRRKLWTTGCSFLGWWTLASTIGLTLGLVAPFIVEIESPLQLWLMWLACGAFVGKVQSWALGWYIPAEGWMLATAIGWTVGMYGGGELVARIDGFTSELTFGAAVGLALGIAQFFVLDKYVTHSPWWIPGSAISLMIAWGIGSFLGGIVDLMGVSVAGFAASLPFIGFIYAILTGLLLWGIGRSY